MNKHDYKVNDEVKSRYQVPIDVFGVAKKKMILQAKWDLMQAKRLAEERGHKDLGYLAAEQFLKQERKTI